MLEAFFAADRLTDCSIDSECGALHNFVDQQYVFTSPHICKNSAVNTLTTDNIISLIILASFPPPAVPLAELHPHRGPVGVRRLAATQSPGMTQAP